MSMVLGTKRNTRPCFSVLIRDSLNHSRNSTKGTIQTTAKNKHTKADTGQYREPHWKANNNPQRGQKWRHN